MRHAALLVVVLVLLVPAASLAASPSAAAVGSASSAGPASPSVTQTAFDANVTIDVHVDSSGDARFNVSTAYRLNSSAEREAFDRVAANFSDGRVGFQADDFRTAAEAAADHTGRSMEIESVNRVRNVHDPGENASWNATGVLALEFTWTEFAKVSDNRILLGDVFATGWLPALEPDLRLRIHSPAQYGVLDADIAPSGGTLVWNGPHSFDDGGPQVVFDGGLDPTSTATATGTTDGGPGDGAGQFRMVLAGLAVLLVGGLLAYVWTQRTPETGLEGDGGPDDDAGAAAERQANEPGKERPVGEGVAAAPDDGGQSDTDGGDAEATDGTGGSEGDGESDEADDGDEIDEELLSDEERVERMLRENGGRMKQANIVTETGWSNAKVSQLLSGMDDEERIEKLRLGRENLIILPDEDDEDLV